MNKINFLPIGTICKLKEVEKKIMITGFLTKSSEEPDIVFDYCGCVYPEGIINSNKNLVFNADKIENIISLGYVDIEQQEFMKQLSSVDIKSNNKN